MKKIFNKFIWISIATCVVFLIVGLMLMFFPTVSLSVVSYCIASLLIIVGILFIINSKEMLFNNFLTSGVLAIVLGGTIFIYPDTLSVIIPIMLGIWMIINSVVSIQISLELRYSKYDGWLLPTLFSILTACCGILIIFNPQNGAEALTIFFGIMLVIYSVSNIMNLLIFNSNSKKIIKLFN